MHAVKTAAKRVAQKAAATTSSSANSKSSDDVATYTSRSAPGILAQAKQKIQKLETQQIIYELRLM